MVKISLTTLAFFIASLTYPTFTKSELVLKPNRRCVGGSDYKRLLARNEEKCTKKCNQDDKCLSFQFAPPNKCTLYDQLVETKWTNKADITCGVDERHFFSQANTMCDINFDWDRAERRNNILSPEKCELECRNKKSCLSYEWKANKSICVLLYDKVDLTDIKALSPSDETKRTCGVFMGNFDSFPPSSMPSHVPSSTPSASVKPTAPTQSPTTLSPTMSPSAAPTYKKVYVGDENTKCGGDIDWSTTKKIKYFSSREQCQRKCSISKKCETYEWNGAKSTCIIFRNRVKVSSILSLKANDSDRICAYTVGSILDNSPVADNSVRKQCILKADLKFDFDHPDDAPYYGYHSDYLEVMESGNYDWICSHRYTDELPDWCTYQNSDPNGEYAYIANFDDEYYDDDEEEIHTETISVFAAAGRNFEFFVYHYFNWNDYYTYLDTWKDHMMAPKLSITNLSHKTQKQVGKGGWSHPVNENVPTHIGKGQINPKYQGKFKVTVSCNNNCYCKSDYKLLR